MKPDDSIDPQQLARIRQEARRTLEAASAVGRFPTPIDEIIEAARHAVVIEQEIDQSFLSRMRKKAGDALRRAMSKVLGVLDVTARVMHLDKLVHASKLPFLKLHELGHGLLGWQRDIYAFMEDCELTLDPDVSELFERESNAFASEVLFQIDSFKNEAAESAFGLNTPLKLSRKYGASVYSSVRRYVTTHDRACAVVVLEPPILCDGEGFKAKVRRMVTSPQFRAQFGELRLPEVVTPDDSIGKMVPIGERRMSRPRMIICVDRNGVKRECVAEAFAHKYNVFILLYPQVVLTRKVLLVTS